MLTKPNHYLQTDPRWKNIMYSATGDAKQTIGSSGCGPTCAAMVIQTLRGDTVAITPKETCAWALKNKFRTSNNGTEFSYFIPQLKAYGITAKQTSDYNRVLAALKDDCMVIGRALKGLWTSGGHYILAYGVDGQNVLVCDPNSQAAARSKAPLATFKAQVGPFWIIEEEWRMQKEDVISIIKEVLDGKDSKSSAWAVADKSWEKVTKSGIMDGKRPQGYMKREEVAALLVKAGFVK